MAERMYVLVRTDLASLNTGKLGAQTHHAASAAAKQFNVVSARFTDEQELGRPYWLTNYQNWTEQTSQGFGTVITLAVPDEESLCQAVDTAIKFGYMANTVLDDTYPVSDGKVTHLLPLITCGYVLSADGSPWFLSNYPLHP